MVLTYEWLRHAARQRFASDAALQARLPRPLSTAQLARKPDARYLSAMTQRVFRAGMQHAMVDAKWPAFEAAFDGFQPEAMAQLSDADIERHMQDASLIRHRAKLQTIPQNARFLLAVRAETGRSFGHFIAHWPVTDIVGLWRVLGQRGARLGGRSGAGFLRLAGKDTFLTTSHVVARLVAAGVVRRAPRSQRDLQAVQAAFNALHAASGRPLCELSALMALSIPPDA